MQNTLVGFLNIDKPPGMTAHDVVVRIRKLLKIRHAGHGGTLDPLATGVLPIALNRACRFLQYIDGRKIYRAEILLGKRTTTDDVSGAVISEESVLPEETAVFKCLQEFTGSLLQTPPVYSAIHIDGKRLYELARQGTVPDTIPPRLVTVYALSVLEIAPPLVRIRIHCSAGTYIRSIARDLGDRLKCGGCLKSLVREQAGPFLLTKAVALEDLLNSADPFRFIEKPESLFSCQSVTVAAPEAKALSHGRAIPKPASISDLSLDPEKDRRWLREDMVLVSWDGKIVALCRRTPDNMLQPEVVVSDVGQID